MRWERMRPNNSFPIWSQQAPYRPAHFRNYDRRAATRLQSGKCRNIFAKTPSLPKLHSIVGEFAYLDRPHACLRCIVKSSGAFLSIYNPNRLTVHQMQNFHCNETRLDFLFSTLSVISCLPRIDLCLRKLAVTAPTVRQDQRL